MNQKQELNEMLTDKDKSTLETTLPPPQGIA
jgi:hypothetical protein